MCLLYTNIYVLLLQQSKTMTSAVTSFDRALGALLCPAVIRARLLLSVVVAMSETKASSVSSPCLIDCRLCHIKHSSHTQPHYISVPV